MTVETFDRKQLARTAWGRAGLAMVIIAALFFIPAGTLAYWQAWVYMAILFIPMTLVFFYLIKHDPELLMRRMRAREREREQRRIVGFSWVYFLVAFILPGFDHRWGWSHVPTSVVLVADLLVLVGYGIFVLVLRANSYLSRTVEVDQGQRVIDTGPYAIVRHPMYSGVILMYLVSPVALGSWWSLIPGMFIVPVLVARILNEEAVLTRDLSGYTEYKQRTRYRLLPGVW